MARLVRREWRTAMHHRGIVPHDKITHGPCVAVDMRRLRSVGRQLADQFEAIFFREVAYRLHV